MLHQRILLYTIFLNFTTQNWLNIDITDIIIQGFLLLYGHLPDLLCFAASSFAVASKGQLLDLRAVDSFAHDCNGSESSAVIALGITMLIIYNGTLVIWTLEIHLLLMITSLSYLNLSILASSSILDLSPVQCTSSI